MNQKSVGEYLKRLRIRENYTQNDLGMRIGVTDKAISRWESGAGMPEISNLMELAKVYGIAVDDILNLNESVFGDGRTDEQQSADGADDTVNGNGGESSDAEKVTASTGKLVDPSAKFPILLLVAYFVFGIFAVPTYAESIGGICTAFFIVFTVVIFAASVLGAVSQFLPRLYRKINMGLWSVMALGMLLFTILSTGFLGFDRAKETVYGCIAFTLLSVMQLLFVVSDLCAKEKVKKIITYCSVGVAALAVVCGIINFTIQPYFSFNRVAVLLVSLCAVLFCLSVLFSKWINVFSVMIILLLAVTNFVQLYVDELQSTIFYSYGHIIDGDINENICVGALTCGLAAIIIGWFFDGYKSELTAKRITSGFAFLITVLVFIFVFDVCAINVITKVSAYAAASFMQIAMMISVCLYCIKSFRFDKLIKSVRKGREAK